MERPNGNGFQEKQLALYRKWREKLGHKFGGDFPFHELLRMVAENERTIDQKNQSGVAQTRRSILIIYNSESKIVERTDIGLRAFLKTKPYQLFILEGLIQNRNIFNTADAITELGLRTSESSKALFRQHVLRLRTSLGDAEELEYNPTTRSGIHRWQVIEPIPGVGYRLRDHVKVHLTR